MILAWSGLAPSIDQLVQQTWTPARGGALAHDLVGTARRHGRIAVEVRGLEALLRELAAGHPVLVLQNLRLGLWPLWHFAVAIGFDLERRELILHTGESPGRRVSLSLFERTWARAGSWGLLALPPSRLPASVGPRAVLRAIAALERSHPDAAAEAYARAAARWPRDSLAPLALGNLLREAGDLAGAQARIREAIARDPLSGAAHNNLADVLLRSGDLEAAAEAIRKAIALDGALPVYRLTRDEIEAAARARAAAPR